MESGFLLELSLILVLTKFFGIVSRRIHLPQVVGALLAGLVLGPAAIGIVQSNDVITNLAEVGVILLMFTAGLETNLQQLRQSLKPALVIATLGAVFPLAGGWALSHFFGFGLMESLFLGVVLMATSVSITVEVLQEMGKIKSKTGTAILGAAIIDDIIGIVILSLLITSNNGNGSAHIGGIALTLLKIALFFVFAWGCAKVINYFFEYQIKRYGNRHRLSIFSLAFCFFLAYLAELFGVSDITGAYLAGLALCNSNAEEYIEGRTHVLSYLFFSPIFFVSIGLNVQLGNLTGANLIFGFLVFLVAVGTKLLGCWLGAKMTGYTKKESLQIGIGMISRGEVALIVLAKGLAVGLASPEIFSVVILVVLLTTLATPPLLQLVFRGEPEVGEVLE